jgi:hypothetical protein
LDLPKIEANGEAVPMVAVSWIALAPDGSQIAPASRPLSAAGAAVRRAAALGDFARGVDSRLIPEQRSRLHARVHDALRSAELALVASPNATIEMGPDGQALADWVKRLRQNAPPNVAAAEIELAGPYAEEFGRGTPTYWFTTDASPPEFRLQPRGSDWAPRIALSVGLAIGMFAGAMLTRRRSAT